MTTKDMVDIIECMDGAQGALEACSTSLISHPDQDTSSMHAKLSVIFAKVLTAVHPERVKTLRSVHKLEQEAHVNAQLQQDMILPREKP